MAARRLGEQPHAGSYSAGQFSSSSGTFTQPCTQWLHKADYKLQRIPEGAKSDAGANEPREPLIPVTEWDKLGKAWTTQIQAHQAAESLPWEPGVIIRPIQRGPGTLGAREAGPHWSASARRWEWRPRRALRVGLGRWTAVGAFTPTASVKPVPRWAMSTPARTPEKRACRRQPAAWTVRNVCLSQVQTALPSPSPAWGCRSPSVPQARSSEHPSVPSPPSPHFPFALVATGSRRGRADTVYL